MKILVLQKNSTIHPSQAEEFLALGYPDADKIIVSDPTELDATLGREEIDLVLIDSPMSWVLSSKMLRAIHSRHPGLSVVLLTPEHSATQKALEQELHHSQFGFDRLLNTPSDMILLIDTQHRVMTANQAFYQRSGKRPEEVIGRTTSEILPPDLAERRDAALRQVFETGQVMRFEDQGVYLWLDITIYPIRDPQGQIIHVIVYAHDITERKNLEDGLRRSHKTIDALLNAPTDIIMLLDRECKILIANRTFSQRFNIKPDEVPGLSVYDFLPFSLAQKRMAIVQQVFETGQVVRYEDKGVSGWFDNSVYPILDDQGQVAAVAVVARDITDRKDLEEILRRDQRAMQAMANAPNDIFLLLDRSGEILLTNHVVAQSMKLKLDELPGLNYWDILPKPAADFRRPIFDRVIQTGVSERVEDRGPFGVYDSRVIPITNDQGEVVQVVIQARDVTERKRNELALKESEERYRTLVETSPDGIAFQDLKGNLLIVNQQFAALFGYEEPKEIYDLQINGADLIAEQDLVQRQEIMRNAWRNKPMRDASFIARRKDGSLFQVEVNGSMVHDPEGNPTGIITICRDVTERERIQEELVKAHQHLEHRVIERTAELQAMNRQLRKEVFLRKQAEEQWKRHALQSEALARVASRANAQLGLKAVLDTICNEIIHVLPYPISSVSLYQESDDSLHIGAFASSVTINTFTIPPTPRALYEEYLRRMGPTIIIPEVQKLQEAQDLAETTLPNICSLVVMPVYNEGELIGSLNVASVGDVLLPTDEELNLLRAIADQAALSITNARLFERVYEGQARLRTLTERLVEVQETEKRHLARELHDQIGQMLTSLSLNLEIIIRSIQEDQEKFSLQAEMERIRGQVKQLLDQVRDLSLNLLPAMLDDLGLLPALLDHCQRFTAQTGISVNLTHRGLDDRVPAHVEAAAYRIVQEALTNVARHAETDQADVRIWATPQELGVQIEDQGVGFELAHVEHARRSSGISGMRERAANCGGNLEIETTPGQGTCLTVEFPLNVPIQSQGKL